MYQALHRFAMVCIIFLVSQTFLVEGLLAHPQKVETKKPDFETTPQMESLKTLNGYFPFKPPKTLEAWQARRRKLRQHLQVSLGLWPMPERTPLNAVVHGKKEMDGYTIENVYFESFPGFYVTGNLYRPSKDTGKKIPAILCPHGHWSNGRFMWNGDDEVKRQLAAKGEREANNARSPLQARCATLAQKGCVVFHYDMIGYADCQQIPHSIAHGFSKVRKELNSKDKWGLFSAQAEMRSQTVMGLQTWNSIRALDFVESLEDVDPRRIGVTGASGGGTQTFILCAIDPRPAVAFPAVMVSTAMQGGCTCENCANLRVETGNVEWAALFAPKPMTLTAANDWTKEMSTKGMPELKALYQLYGKPENVSLLSRTEFGHNYNRVSRTVMYDWFQKHLHFTDKQPEEKIKALQKHDLTVWNESHPAPKGGNLWEAKMLAEWSKRNEKQIGWNNVQYPDQLETQKKLHEIALRRLMNLVDGEVRLKMGKPQLNSTRQSNTIECLLSSDAHPIKTKVLMIEPARARKTANYAIYLGKNRIAGENFGGDWPLAPDKNKVFRNEATIIGMDLYASIKPPVDARTPRDPVQNLLVKNDREAAGYTYGYNRTILACRVQQVVDLVRYLKDAEPNCTIELFADRATAPIVLYAAAVLPKESIRSVMADSSGLFRFRQIDDIRHEYFLPGIVKFGDMDGLVSLAILKGVGVWLKGEDDDTLPNAVHISKMIGQDPNHLEDYWQSSPGSLLMPRF